MIGTFFYVDCFQSFDDMPINFVRYSEGIHFSNFDNLFITFTI